MCFCILHAALFALNISKLITSIFGGVVTTNDRSLATALRNHRDQTLRSASRTKSIRRLLYLLCASMAFSRIGYPFTLALKNLHVLDRLVKYYDENTIDFPADFDEQLTDLEARVGLTQLRKYSSIIRTRRQNAELWRDSLEKIADEQDLFIPDFPIGTTFSHFPVSTPNKERLLRSILSQRCELGEVVEYCIPLMAAYQSKNQDCQAYPVASRLARQMLNFPVHHGVNSDLPSKIVDSLLTKY